MMQWNKYKEKMYLCVLLLTALKITFEFVNHQTIFTSLAAQAVPSSHAAGFLAGVLYLLLFVIKNKMRCAMGGLFKNYVRIRV